MWVLVAVLVTGSSSIDSRELGRYETMASCFNERDQVLVSKKAYTGVPPINTQYVCVLSDYK